MDAITGMHNAARRYCFDLFSKWEGVKYGGIGRNAWLIRAVLDDIESLSPSDYSSPEELRQMLMAAGQTARDEWGEMGLSEGQQRALEDERRRFCKFIEDLDVETCMRGPRVPFRRVLKRAEAKAFNARFFQTWGRWYGGGCDRDDIPPNATLHTDAMNDPAAYEAIRTALRARGIARVFEWREWGHSYEMDIDLAEFQYTGAEGFWFMDSVEWMITASHESSITFGSEWLIRAMRESLKEFDRYIYKGWDSNGY